MIISATQRIDPRIDLLAKTHGSRSSPSAAARPGTDYPWIDLDFEGVANRRIDRLVAHGHRRIAMALPRNDINLGYVFLDGLQAALAAPRPAVRSDPRHPRQVERAGRLPGRRTRLLGLTPRPTAVLLIYELMAIGLYRRLNEAGILPGRDLAVIGFREVAAVALPVAHPHLLPHVVLHVSPELTFVLGPSRH